jgi:hypothetical protein
MGLYDTIIFSPVFTGDFTTPCFNNALHDCVIPYISAPWTLSILEKGNATRSNLESTISSVSPSIVWLASHGGPDLVCDGYNYILKSCTSYAVDLSNAHLFSNKIVYIMACESGQKLAPEMVNKGAKAVLAYTDVLWFTIDVYTMRLTKPFEDVLCYPRELYKFKKVGQVYDEMMGKFDYWLDCLKYWEPEARDFLLNDRDCFKLFGDRNAAVPSVAQLVASTGGALATATAITLALQYVLLKMLNAVLRRE